MLANNLVQRFVANATTSSEITKAFIFFYPTLKKSSTNAGVVLNEVFLFL